MVTKQDRSKSETVSKPDGSSRSVVTDSQGVKVETITTSLGEVTAEVHLAEGVAQARITIPVKKASASTVAYTVRGDRSRTIIGTSVMTEDGLSILVRGDVIVKLVDNKITFKDVNDPLGCGVDCFYC